MCLCLGSNSTSQIHMRILLHSYYYYMQQCDAFSFDCFEGAFFGLPRGKQEWGL